MFGLIRALAAARAVRPLLAWVLAVLGFVVFRPPQEFVLLLVVGLGVALAMTVGRLREGRRDVADKAGRAWQLAERLAGAVEDRIRHGDPDDHPPLYGQPMTYGQYGQVPAGGLVYGQVGGGPVVAYDPGALLSAVVAVLAAEGLPTDPGPALLPAAHLLADLGINAYPGVPAPTAMGLVDALTVGPTRRVRVLPAGLLAAVVRVVLTHDQVLPEQVSTDTADTLVDHSAAVLIALRVQPGDAGSLADWPVIAQIIDAAPLPVPYEQWDR
jgi:hypothetical protein